MIAEALIREALTPDPLEEAARKVQTRKYAAILRERRERVHSALAGGHRSIPIAPDAAGCSRQVVS